MKLLASILFVLSLLLSGPSLADTTPKAVTPWEFRHVYVGETQNLVEQEFGAHGWTKWQYYDEIGVGHWSKNYHTIQGPLTWVRVQYRLGLSPTAKWRLVKKEWCVHNDFQSGFVCKQHPW